MLKLKNLQTLPNMQNYHPQEIIKEELMEKHQGPLLPSKEPLLKRTSLKYTSNTYQEG